MEVLLYRVSQVMVLVPWGFLDPWGLMVQLVGLAGIFIFSSDYINS